MRTGIPSQGRSLSRRQYRLCKRRDDWPHEGQRLSIPDGRNTITNRLFPSIFSSQSATSPASGTNVRCPIGFYRRPPELPLFLPQPAHLGSITKCAEEPLLSRHVTPPPRRNMVYFSCGAYNPTVIGGEWKHWGAPETATEVFAISQRKCGTPALVLHFVLEDASKHRRRATECRLIEFICDFRRKQVSRNIATVRVGVNASDTRRPYGSFVIADSSYSSDSCSIHIRKIDWPGNCHLS